MKKEFVSVIVKFDEIGKKHPLSIIWNNGKIYEIDKVISVKNRASMKVGGIGERYEIRINNHITYLFFEDGKWFVEQKK